MSHEHIKEITRVEYDNAMASDTAREINWFSQVAYEDGSFKWFVFDEPYNVKVSDFFDPHSKDNPVLSITLI